MERKRSSFNRSKYGSFGIVPELLEAVVDELARLEVEIPLDYLLLSPLSEKTFWLFTEKVLPHVLS